MVCSFAVDLSHMAGLRHLQLDHNRISSLQDVRLLALNLNLKSITLNDNPLCEEANYLKQATSLLPQVENLDQTSVVSAHLCRSDVGKLYVNDSPSTTPRQPHLSPFVNPSTPSPRMMPPSPGFKPAAMHHGGRVPDVEHGDEFQSHAFGVSPSGPRFPRNDEHWDAGEPPRVPHRASAHRYSLNLAGGDNRGVMSLSTLSSQSPPDAALEDYQPSIEDFDDNVGLPEGEESMDFWEQSTTNAHKNSVMSANSKALSSRDRRPSAMQMLAQVAMTEVALADPVCSAHDNAALDASHPRMTSLTGTGRVGSVVVPRVARTSCTPQKSATGDDSHTQPYKATRGSSPCSRSRSHGSRERQAGECIGDDEGITKVPERPRMTSRSSRASPPDSRPTHVTRVAASKISPGIDSKKRSSPGTKTSPSSNPNQGRISSLSPPGSRAKAPSSKRKKRSMSPTVDVAEIVIEIEQALKITRLVFQAWKLILAYSRLIRHFDRKDSGLVLVSRGRHNVMLLRPVFEAWAHIQGYRQRSKRHIDRRGCVAQVRSVLQVLHEWSALARFQKLFGVRMRRRQRDLTCSLLKDWRQMAVDSLRKKAVVYRQWRRRDTVVVFAHFDGWKGALVEAHRLLVVRRRVCRILLNRQLGVAFEAFVELRELASKWEADIGVRLKKLQVDRVDRAFMVWVRALTKKITVSNLVSNVCRKFFAVNLEAHLRAWHRLVITQARLSGICSSLGNTTRRETVRAVLSRFESHKIQQVYRRRVIAKIERLRRAGLLRAWRLIVFGSEVHSRLLKLCERRRRTVTQSRCLRVWIKFNSLQRQLTNIEEGCNAIGKKREHRQKMRALSNWLHVQLEKREHLLIVTRALQKRRRRLANLFLARVRSKVLKAKTQNTMDTVMVRKVTRHFMRVFLEQWNRKTRQNGLLRRRLPVVEVRRLEFNMRGVLYGWHEVAHRRFQVAAMLDKILLRRKQQHSVSPEVHASSRRNTPRLNLARHPPRSPRQPSTSPRLLNPDSRN